MDRQYITTYQTNKINIAQLKTCILRMFQKQQTQKQFNYDQLLFLLDTHTTYNKCNRDVFQELFHQTANAEGKTTLFDVVYGYVQNIQTCKLCLIRDRFRQQLLKKEYSQIQDRNNCFIFLKVLQLSITSCFTKSPHYQYRIQPSNIPPVILTNSINPVLNHEFVLEMEEDSFEIVFYQSGIKIFTWVFPDENCLVQGEYERSVVSQNCSFDLHLKYIPKTQAKKRIEILQQINVLQQKISNQETALKKLCQFQPFLKPIQLKQNNQQHFGCIKITDIIIELFPCFKKHILFLFRLLILTIICECFASSFWSIQFIDLIAIFYLLSVLLDHSTVDLSATSLLSFIMVFSLLMLKSIWGAASQPYFMKTNTNKAIMVFCVVLKLLITLSLSLTLIRQHQIGQQIRDDLKDGAKFSKHLQFPNQIISSNIWQH